MRLLRRFSCFFFFFNDTATTEIYTLSLHDALPIFKNTVGKIIEGKTPRQIEKIRILDPACGSGSFLIGAFQRSEEHTSELQSRLHLVCRLLLEKKKHSSTSKSYTLS